SSRPCRWRPSSATASAVPPPWGRDMGPAPFMRELATFAGVGLALLSTPGCLDKVDQGPSGPRLQIEVAPLNLDQIVEATYTITVRNDGGEVVWSAGPLASIRFGDGQGAITYIGP